MSAASWPARMRAASCERICSTGDTADEESMLIIVPLRGSTVAPFFPRTKGPP
jgi:hypothetical protein